MLCPHSLPMIQVSPKWFWSIHTHHYYHSENITSFLFHSHTTHTHSLSVPPYFISPFLSLSLSLSLSLIQKLGTAKPTNKHNPNENSNDAILPAIVSVLAFLLSLAGWWLAWIAGLIAAIVWVLAVCCDLPDVVMKSALIGAIVALICEVLVAISVFDAGAVVTFSEFSSSTLTIISIVACVLWAVVAVISYRKHW